MIDIRLLESDQILLNQYKEGLRNRKYDGKLVDEILALNAARKKLTQEFDEMRAEQNKASQSIAMLKKKGEDATQDLSKMKELSEKVKAVETELSLAEESVKQKALHLPNFLHESVPIGASEDENVIVRSFMDPKSFSFRTRDHVELGESLGVLDTARATKVTGARFSILTGLGARLERALTQFMLDVHTKEHDYIETVPPYLVNDVSLVGTSQLPKFREDLFAIEGTNYFLVPTAEVPVTNYYRDEILEEAQLPICYTAFTPCFRSEAGSYGRDTKGLIRQHQFHKVELVKFTHPDRSYEEHEKLVKNAEEILKRLELPFQVALLCSGDISFGAAKCYDLNVWLPGQSAYREISSCSNFEDFQARRAQIRFRPNGPKAKPRFVHTLNGSGLAVGRTWVAILENYQREDGSVEIPKALIPYMGGVTELRPQGPKKEDKS